jgi:hypothetical protein
MNQKIARLFMTVLSVSLLAGCGDEKEDKQNILNSAEHYGQFADVGKGTVVLNMAEGTLADTVEAAQVEADLGFAKMKVTGVNKLSSTSLSVSMEGKCVLDGVANMGRIRLNYKATSQTDYNYICTFPIVTSLIDAYKNETSRSGTSSLIITTNIASLRLLNGAKWVDSAINSNNITVSTSDETNYPLSALKFVPVYLEQDVVLTYASVNDLAGYTVSFAAATNDFNLAQTAKLTSL